VSHVASTDRLLAADTALRRRAVAAGPVVAGVTLAAAVIVTAAAGVPLRDPGGVSARRLLTTVGLFALFAGADLLFRGGRERWSRRRMVSAAIAVASFYVTYFAYRNLKSVVPLIRPGSLYDQGLTDLDHGLLGGHGPADVLHTLLGTGVSAQVLSAVYMFFFAFIPLSLAAALALARDEDRALFFTTAIALNWLLAAISYYLLPSIGPFHAEPGTFAHLPTTAVSHLQDRLIGERAAFLHDPSVPGSAQSIGAFASLHVSVWFTAALGAHLLRLPIPVRVVLWVLTGLTMLATVYFGWHYLLDDAAGVAIAAVALTITRAITGRVPRPEAA
jgi:hypothetical protein